MKVVGGERRLTIFRHILYVIVIDSVTGKRHGKQLMTRSIDIIQHVLCDFVYAFIER